MRGARTDRPVPLSASVAESNYDINHLELISFSWELVFPKKNLKFFFPEFLFFLSVFLLTSVLVEVLY